MGKGAAAGLGMEAAVGLGMVAEGEAAAVGRAAGGWEVAVAAD